MPESGHKEQLLKVHIDGLWKKRLNERVLHSFGVLPMSIARLSSDVYLRIGNFLF